MSSATQSLLGKELKQNYIIYGLSVIFLAGVWLIHWQYFGFVPKDWAQILVVSIPVALAGAYGLQAFDLEENYRTRDFLLSRPLTVASIIWTKYLCGLVILLFFTILWLWALLPAAVRFPVFTDFQSFWGSAFLAMVILIYSTCFSAGVFIKGPKKLLFGIILNLLVLPWFFFCWLKLLSLFYFYPATMDYPVLAYMVVFVVTLGLMIVIIGFFQRLTQLFLQNTFFEMGKKSIIIYLSVIIFLPLLSWTSNAVWQPTICPFHSLWSSLFSSEEWFIASQGAEQPGGDMYALADYRGRIGLTRKNEKPSVIYQGEHTVNQLSQIVWAPDGKKIAFFENGRIKVMTLATRQLWPGPQGDIPFWSADANQMLIIKKISAKDPRDTAANFQIFLVDFLQGTGINLGSLAAAIDPLAWDSVHHNILFVDEDWQLLLMNMRDRKLQVLNLPIRRLSEKIFFKEIISPPLGRSVFRVAVFSFSPVLKKPLPYNVYLYDFDSRFNKVSYVSVLKGLSYLDLVISPTANNALAGVGKGIYRMIQMPAREGR
ncbi:MAG TPA: hypothetical protein DDW50_18245 [Firmicutes bacterium]|jgi:hypothetical protein|nr:hypothetical protein [Bacillota bacterium]